MYCACLGCQPESAGEAGPLAPNRRTQPQQQDYAEDLAAAKFRQQEVVDLGNQVRAQVDELAEEYRRWSEEVESLPMSDEGRKLAAYPESVATFRIVYASFKPDDQLVARMHTAIDGLTRESEQALADDKSFYRTTTGINELNVLKSNIADALDTVRSKRRQISVIKRAAEPAEMTLEAALESQALGEARQEISRIEGLHRDEEAARAELATGPGRFIRPDARFSGHGSQQGNTVIDHWRGTLIIKERQGKKFEGFWEYTARGSDKPSVTRVIGTIDGTEIQWTTIEVIRNQHYLLTGTRWKGTVDGASMEGTFVWQNDWDAEYPGTKVHGPFSLTLEKADIEQQPQ
jgi:hypothetical protein